MAPRTQRTRRPTSRGASTEAPPLDTDAYARFIGQIQLQGVWLESAKITNRAGPVTPERASIRIEDKPSWEAHDWGFRASTTYQVRLTDGKKQLALIDVTFAVDFASAEPMTDAIFEAFGDVNLPVNTWPYLREFLASILGRMNWTPFTLPAIKRGTRPAKSNPSNTESNAEANGGE